MLLICFKVAYCIGCFVFKHIGILIAFNLTINLFVTHTLQFVIIANNCLLIRFVLHVDIIIRHRLLLCLIEILKSAAILYILIKLCDSIISILWSRVLVYYVFDVFYEIFYRFRFFVIINRPTICFGERVKESPDLFSFSRIYILISISIVNSVVVNSVINIILFAINISCCGRVII